MEESSVLHSQECDGDDNPYCEDIIITGTPNDMVFEGFIDLIPKINRNKFSTQEYILEQ